MTAPAVQDVVRRGARGTGAVRVGAAVLTYGALIVVALAALTPLLWLLRSSLMTTAEIFAVPPRLFPDPIEWQNFPGALTAQPFGRYFLNTLSIVALVIPGVLLSTSAAAFAFSRLTWPGRRLVFGAVLSALLLPWAVTLVPTFVMWQSLGQTNTIVPLTVPSFFAAGAGFNVFLLRQFFSQVPLEYDHAVYVDGGSPWTVYWRVMLPLNKGPLALVAIFTTIATWNDLIGPLIYLNSPEKFTLTLGLTTFQSNYIGQWGYLMAATVVVLAPLLVLFAFAQRSIIEGVTMSGLKG